MLEAILLYTKLVDVVRPLKSPLAIVCEVNSSPGLNELCEQWIFTWHVYKGVWVTAMSSSMHVMHAIITIDHNILWPFGSASEAEMSTV